MRIYLDTSVINGLFAINNPRILEATKAFFSSATHGHFTLYISDLVAEEIRRTVNVNKRQLLIKTIEDYDIQNLPITEETNTLASRYVQAKIIPAKYIPDALHIATASVHNIPVLASWNFEHIVKHKTRTEVNMINTECGYPSIDICSPEEV